MSDNDHDTNELIDRAEKGDSGARDQLILRHQARLRHMIALRMDRRLLARIDPSDVVQEALAEAYEKLSLYLQRKPLPFYPWLRQLALERLIELHRRHVQAQKRSVMREEGQPMLPDESVLELAQRLISGGTSPSQKVIRDELRERVERALSQLADKDREVLVMRHLEQMSMAEIAAVVGTSEGAVKVRHLRALERIRAILHEE